MAVRGNGLYLGRFIERDLRESVYNTAVNGSTFSQLGERVQAAGLRDNPLIIWDGAAVIRAIGSIDMELGIIDAIVRLKAPRRNWLIVLSVVIRGQTRDLQVRDDMAALGRELTSRYGGEHVFDALPILHSLSNGSDEDRGSVALGMVPPSLLLDGLHLNQPALEAVSQVLTRTGGPMATVRNL